MDFIILHMTLLFGVANNTKCNCIKARVVFQKYGLRFWICYFNIFQATEDHFSISGKDLQVQRPPPVPPRAKTSYTSLQTYAGK